MEMENTQGKRKDTTKEIGTRERKKKKKVQKGIGSGRKKKGNNPGDRTGKKRRKERSTKRGKEPIKETKGREAFKIGEIHAIWGAFYKC